MWIGYVNKYIFLDFSDSVDMFIIVSKNPELYSKSTDVILESIKYGKPDLNNGL